MNFRNSTLRTQRQVRLPRLSVIHKKYCFSDFHYSSFCYSYFRYPLLLIEIHPQILTILIVSVSVSNHLTTRICSPFHQNILLPEIAAPFSEHLTTRNCCFVFRTSYTRNCCYCTLLIIAVLLYSTYLNHCYLS